MKVKLLIAALIAAIVSCVYGTDMEKMKAKILVQEKIIDTILESDSPFTVASETRGIYITEFGAVFTIQVSEEEFHSRRMIWELPEIPEIPELPDICIEFDEWDSSAVDEQDSLDEYTAHLKQYEIALVKYYDALERTQSENQLALERNINQKLDSLFRHLKEYIADYGPALMLPDNERLMLRGSFQSLRLIDDNQWEFEIWAKGADLKKLRSGKLNREDFLELIDYRGLEGEYEIPTDIIIMNTILKSTCKEDYGNFYMWHLIGGEESWGTYIDGFGALFFQSKNTGFSIFTLSGIPNGIIPSLSITINGEDEEGIKQLSAEVVQKNISDLMVTYTPTLKSVKPDEQVVIAVKFDRDIDDEKHRMLIFKVKKNVFDKYTDDNELLKKIEVVKF